MMQNGAKTAVFATVLGLGALPAAAGPAVNQFEVKDLQIEQGEVEIEDQSDFIVSGKPRRKFVEGEDGAIEFDDNEVSRQRHSIEIGFGLASWLKVGGGLELEEERVDDPPSFAEAQNFDSLKGTEIQFEGVAVLIPVKDQGIGLGVYAELQLPIETEARTLFFGPVIQAISGPWSATGNFAFVKFMGGAQEADEEGNLLPRDEKWDFAYFTQIKYQASDSLALALEAYGTIDRLGDSGNASEAAQAIGDLNQHRFGPVGYYAWTRPATAPVKGNDDKGVQGGDKDDDDEGGVTLSAGLLFGLNDNTPDTTVKTGLEIEF